MKYKVIIFMAALLCSYFYSYSQSNRVTIKGVLRDSVETIPYSALMLLDPIDTTLITFTTTNDKGEFVFKNIKNRSYIFKATHVSHVPLQMLLKEPLDETVELGNVYMKPISRELMEVVIKAARAPLYIRGDTIEYDAATFKIPEGSSVEDLLKRLPGIEVDKDGNIKSQGEEVNKVYVDGKTFFGDDPKSVTKNLDAKAVSKVQVFDEKSEQEKLTGIKDSKENKAMNLELKEGYKKGSFGKISLAGGTEERWAARGNYNRFNDKQQLSFIGFANNINETGVNWDDYTSFKGNNSFNNFDNGDFGFGGHRRIFYFNGRNSILNYYDGRGLTENAGGGVNYNYDNKKLKFSGSYLYNQTGLKFNQFSDKTTFLQNSSINSLDTTRQDNFNSAHSIGTRFEIEPDSNQTIIAKVNYKYSTQDEHQILNQNFFQPNQLPINTVDLDNDGKSNTNNLTSAMIYRLKMKKPGRSIALSAGYNMSLDDGTDNNVSIKEFFQANTFTEQISHLINKDKNTKQLKSSALYTEPLSEKFFLQGFYNFSNTLTDANRQIKNNDPLSSAFLRIDSLSRYYENRTMYNRLGTSLQYSYNGLNIHLGLAAQQLALEGKYAVDKDRPWLEKPLERKFENFTPYFELNYEVRRGTRFMLQYENSIEEPSFTDLQPVQNTSNPAYRFIGNPDLKPENNHIFSMNFYYWNPASFSSMGFNARYNYQLDSRVYNQRIELIENQGVVNITHPENMDHSTSFNTWMWSHFPIVKTKLTMGLFGHVQLSKSPIKINDIKNTTDSKGYDVEVEFNFTPDENLMLDAGVEYRQDFINYSIQKSQNQTINSYELNAGIKWQFIKKTFLESNFDLENYKNETFGFNRQIPIWNASIRRLLGKNNKFEVRLAAFDLLNKNETIQQVARQNYVLRTETNTLARYFMLSLTYNMKGFEDKLKGRHGF